MKIKSRHVTTHKLRTLSMCKSASQPASQPASQLLCKCVKQICIRHVCMCQLPSKGMLSKDVSWIHSLAMDIQWKDILMQLFGRHLAKLKYITVYARDKVNGICQSILSAFYNCIHYFRPILRVKISFFPFGLLLLLPLVNMYIVHILLSSQMWCDAL